MKKLKIGIIGCGAIGSTLSRIIKKRFSPSLRPAFLCDRQKEKALRLARELDGSIRIVSIDRLVRGSDLVIEAASPQVAWQAARLAARYQKEILIMSVGGLLGHPVLSGKRKAKIWVPSGAIAGIDGLLAAREAGLQSVKIVTRKPPQGLRGAPYFKKSKFPALHGKKEYCVFKGTAREAVKVFPQNINVAAVLSLAGLGASRTGVEIWTSNAYRHNQHEITVRAKSGEIRTVAQNIPSKENPKTSALAIYAAVATLRKILSAFRVGT